MLGTTILQSGIETDSMDQLQNKLKRYTTTIEALRGKSIGKNFKVCRSKVFQQRFLLSLGTDKLREELYDAVYTSRYLPLEDRKNKPFHELLLRLYGNNQVTELASICTKDVLQSKQERDQANELKIRDDKIDQLTRTNQDLQSEIDRLKANLAELAAKNTKTPWKPVPASVTITPRDPNANRPRQTLKTTSVQFGGKSGTN